MRRAFYTHNRKKAIELILAQGLAMECPDCGVLYDPTRVFGGKCIEHGGELMTDETDTAAEEFDAMWEDAEPVDTAGPYGRDEKPATWPIVET